MTFILPQMQFAGSSSGALASFQITAVDDSFFVGWDEFAFTGSASGSRDLTGGGVVRAIGWHPSTNENKIQLSPSQLGLTSISVDGASYPLTVFSGLGSIYYQFSTGTQLFFSGQTYNIEIF